MTFRPTARSSVNN